MESKVHTRLRTSSQLANQEDNLKGRGIQGAVGARLIDTTECSGAHQSSLVPTIEML